MRRNTTVYICLVLGLLCGGVTGIAFSQASGTSKRQHIQRINSNRYYPVKEGIRSFRAGIKVVLMARYFYKGAFDVEEAWPVIAMYFTLEYDQPDDYEVSFVRYDAYQIANGMGDNKVDISRQEATGRYVDISPERVIRQYRRNLKNRVRFYFRRFILPAPFQPEKNEHLYSFETDRSIVLVEELGYPSKVFYYFSQSDYTLGKMVLQGMKGPPYPYNVRLPVPKYEVKVFHHEYDEEKQYFRALETDIPYYFFSEEREKRKGYEGGMGLLRPQERTSESSKLNIWPKKEYDFDYATVQLNTDEVRDEKIPLLRSIKVTSKEKVLDRRSLRHIRPGQTKPVITNKREIHNTFTEHFLVEQVRYNGKITRESSNGDFIRTK